MRVHSVEAIAVEIPLTKNFGGSTYAVLKRSTVVTRMRTDAGLLSEVYNGDNREHGREIVRLIHEVWPRFRGSFGEYIFGRDASSLPDGHPRHAAGALRLDPGLRRRGLAALRREIWSARARAA